jgi:hypothetical protein
MPVFEVRVGLGRMLGTARNILSRLGIALTIDLRIYAAVTIINFATHPDISLAQP